LANTFLLVFLFLKTKQT